MKISLAEFGSRRFIAAHGLVLVALACMGGFAAYAQPLTTLEYRISGVQLRVTPAALSVPKGIAGSVLVELSGGAGTNSPLTAGAFVEATLRGPSFPARRVIGQVNQALLLPPLPIVGDYQLDNIRLVRAEGTNTITLQEGSPSSVPIRVFDEVLVSRVTSRPLTLDEIREKGIVIDDKNFRAIEFEVGFVIDGKTIPVRFPVVAPAFAGNTEIIPAAELERRLAEAEAINNQLDLSAVLPKELETARLNIDIKGINFQITDEFEQDLALSIPAIPALMVIPGNVGFLNQFFSVQIFTENAAPQNSGLSVVNLKALLKLPPGPDLLVSTNYDQPGDDPLRFARIGSDKIIQPIQPIVRPGADGQTGTSDDIPRLLPGEAGTGEFLVEGLQEGLHVMDLDLTADLEGLAAGIVRIKGKAAGSVLVRNPKFSLAFSHPRTVRSGEPYDLYVTILNTSGTVANLVQVAMAAASISGGNLESAESVVLGTILPGQTLTAKFRIRATRTGAISFSNLTTSDDSLVGRFRLRGGFDERGVALSPDTIGMPGYVTNLPPSLVDAANRVLGQALSVATAGQLPAGVKAIGKSVVTRRVLELAEAGQRVQYGDPLPRVLADVLLDWQGARSFNAGFDQIVRETDAGREWREAVALHQEQADNLNAVTRLAARLPDLAGRGEPWAIFALDAESGTIRFGALAPLTPTPSPPRGEGEARYDHTNASSGLWFVTRPGTNLVFEWRPDVAVPAAELALALLETNGTAQHFRWSVANVQARACLSFDVNDPFGQLLIDNNCDGTSDAVVVASISTVNELPPAMISVRQDPSVLAGRPSKICSTVVGFPLNYGTVLAVLFSKPMTQDRVNVPSAYTLENGNVAGSVQIQPGGRVALLNMRQPVGALRPRIMTVNGVTDPRGSTLLSNALPVISALRGGAAVRGRVARGDGSPAAGVPVTLTYYDQVSVGLGGCEEFIVRPAQVFTDADGYFSFDFVISGLPYSISATDTLGLSPEAIALILESTRADEFQRSRLLELASSRSAQNTLLADFAVGALTDVVAKAEGLDRALLRDFIGPGSGREGTEVPVALRFRGRGAVAGRVVLADGVTPVSRVAVNLFPDPASRELGRGLFSDSDGRFAFFGVPLGIFSIEANSGTGLSRTIAGVIEQPGQTTNVLIVLSSAQVARTDLTGRVTENDNATPHAGATAYVGKIDGQGKFCCVVAAPTADSDGFWRASGIPADTYVLMAVSRDGKRKGERHGISAPSGVTNFASISLQGFGVVIGRVETATGIPVVNAIVAGGEQLVRTTNNGTFRLTGVPTGLRTISAGAERSGTSGAITTPAFSFPRLGSAGVNVLPGVENFVIIRFEPKGSLIGRVVDETGTNAVTGINVALPEAGGFQWVPVNSRGEFFFEGIALKKYTVSAPAPPVFDTDVSGLLETISDRGSSEGDIQAAIGEAFAIFTGAADPLLNGEGAAFNPGRWGFIETELIGDGEIKNVTIQFFRSSTIAGRVLNGQGVPIGARVRLTGVGPALNGGPTTVIRGERNSDPALGTFSFERQAFIGSYGLQASSPFFPIVVVKNGFTSEVQPDDTNVVLQFPATRDINGRLAGTVFNPDGSIGASGVVVRISFSADYRIFTRADGTFDTQIGLPALQLDGTPGRGYFVEAEDLVTGARGAASVAVMPGNTNVAGNLVDVRLLGRGALRVMVLQNDGTPAVGARLGYDQGSYPSDRLPLNSGPFTDSNGQAIFLNLFEGFYGVCARLVVGPTALSGRAGAGVGAGQTNSVTIRLGPTGNIEGTFVKRDGVTPVTFAQVAVGNLGFATTDTNGFFRVFDVPIGAYRLTSSDPVSGIGATLTTVLSFNGQTNVVRLIEQSRGEIRGAVIASDGTTLAPGVNVTLNVSDGITSPRTVTTGPDGRFSFPGAASGPFELSAQHPITRLTGRNSAVLPENAAFFEVNVALQPLAAVTIVVLRPDRVTPATNTAVQFGELAADTDSAGQVRFSDVRLGAYTVAATSRILSENRSVARTNVSLLTPGQAPDVVIVLDGVGRVNGQVFLSNGSTPAAGAVVTLSHLGSIQRYSFVTTTDGNGRFVISNVAVGPYEVSARFGTLGTRVAGAIAFDGEADTVSLTVEPSATVKGRLVRADGVTPVAFEDVNLTLPGRGLPGSLFRTGTNGLFDFPSLPLGLFRLQSTALRFNGIALREGTLTFDGETNDVGNLVMDEDDPRVVTANPPDTAVGVPITTQIQLVFNEALRSNTVDTTGVYLQGPSNTVGASVQLLNDTNGVPRVVRLAPTVPLKSLTTYRIVVVDNIRQDAFGGIIGRGPQDLVGRPLVAPFLATFTTADNDPPLLLSIFPTNGQIQIDPRAVMRLSFNEPIRETNFSLTLTGTNGLVPGTASVGLNGLVLAFAPAAALEPNTTYTLSVSNIFDLAGNRATNEPFVATFSTLDTLGPDIAALTIVSNRTPVAGSTVSIEALLIVSEPGASVRFTQDLNAAGSDTNAPFRVDVALPASGSTTVRAIATDRFGNDGPLAEFLINTVSNEPPAVSLTRVEPVSGPVFRGEPFTVRVSATDDAGVTNIALTATGALNLLTNLPGVGSADVTLFVPTNAIVGSLLNLRVQAADFAGLLSSEATLNLVVSNLNHRPVTLAGASGAGGALRFDGVNDFVSVASSPSVNPTTALTLEAWVFAENLNAGQIGIAGTWDDNNGGFRTYLLWILGGRLEFIISSFARPSDPQTFPVNRWVHVAATYDGSVVRLYRDGTNIASVASSGAIAANNRPFLIGRTEGGSNGPDFFPGSIDEVRLWNRALSPAEIAGIHSRALLGVEPGLVGYWPFNEASGTTTADRTINNNMGTLGGGNAASQPVRVASTAPISGVAISTNTSLALLPLVLDGSDPDGDPITAIVATLPSHGTLFQTADGVTPGAAITNVPATVTSTSRTVILRRQPGFSGRDQFIYVLNDGLTNSAAGLVQLDLATPPGLDTDGDGMPDGFEFANGLNPLANDAALDPDSDGLTNLDEFLLGSDPLSPQPPPPPAALALSGNVADENQPAGTLVGTLLTPDHWDFQQGSVITSSSGFKFDGRDLFGGAFSATEAGTAIFADGQQDGFVHFVEWQTTSPLTIRSFRLRAGHDGGGSLQRSFKRFNLYRFHPVTAALELVQTFDPPLPYPTGFIDLCADLPIVTGQRFRAEFVQNGNFSFPGPRVNELDGFTGTNCANRYTFSLVSGAGDTDNALFTIEDARLLTAAPLDFELRPTYSVRVRVADAVGQSLEQAFTISVTNDTSEDGDQDGLTDAAELALGTDPRNPDTDGDGLLDGVDPDPLNGTIACAPIPPGLIHWYPGDLDGRNVAGTNSGALEGAVTAGNAGKVGGAFRFNGVSGGVNLGNVPDLDFATNASFSIEAWFNCFGPTASFNDGQAIVLLNHNCGNTAQAIALANLGSSFGKVSFSVRDANGLTTNVTSQPLATNQFHHVVGVREVSGTNRTLRFYVNGVLIGSHADPTTGPLALNTPDLIGRRNICGTENIFNGLIDDVSIYNRALTTDEVQALFTAGSAGKCVSCAPAPTGLASWWRAEDNALDATGLNHGGLSNGVSFANGRVGRGFRFDGVNDFIEVPNTSALNPATITLEAWVNPAAITDGSRIISKDLAASSCAAPHVAYSLSVRRDRGNRATFHFTTTNDNVLHEVNSTSVIPTNAFTQLAATFDGNVAKIYVNGVLENSVVVAGTLRSTVTPLVIGNGAQGCRALTPGNVEFNGVIDEVAIYSRSLTGAEVQSLFAAGSAGKCPSVCAPLPPGAVAWWRAESNALDASGTNHGTLNNGAGFAPGLAGQSFAFDGTSGFVSVPDSPALRPASLTLEGWFRFNTVSSLVVLMSKPLGSGTLNSYALYVQNSNLRGTACNAAGFTELISTFSPVAGRWHHLAYTFDDSTDTHVLYADGVVVASGANTRVLDYDSHPVLIGAESNNEILGFFFNGQADEPAIYDRALSPAEVQAIFNAGSAGKCVPSCVPTPSNLAAWWPGNDSPNDIIGGIPGSLQNGAGFTNGGFVGSAFRLDGVDDFVDIGPLAAIDNASELTVAAWVKRQNTDTTVAGIIGKWDTGGAAANTFLLYNGEGGLMNQGSFALAFDDSSLAATAGTTIMDRNQWYHLAVTWRNSDGQFVFYKNGAPERFSAAGAGRLLQTHRSFTAKIGEWGVLRDFRYKWPGLIDEVMVFSRALGSNEIAAIAAAADKGVCLPQPCIPAPAGLVGWWRGQDDALDQVGTNHGILRFGATFTNGLVGRAFSLTGQSQFIEIPSAPSLVITGAISIEAWLFPRHPVNGSVVLSKTAGRPGRAGWHWQWISDGRLQFYVDGDGDYFSGIEREVEAVAGTVPSNTWTHVVTTFDPATQVMKMYANGVEATTTLTRGGTVNGIFPTTDPIRISGFQGSQSNPTLHFFGFVDEVALYNRELSAGEVAAIFNAGSFGKCMPDGGSGRPTIGAPQEPLTPPLLISGFTLTDILEDEGADPREMILRWTAPAGAVFDVETSVDLIHWTPALAAILESAPGRFEGRVALPGTSHGFLRVRMMTR